MVTDQVFDVASLENDELVDLLAGWDLQRCWPVFGAKGADLKLQNQVIRCLINTTLR
jgi:hypothetical protein